MTQNENIKEICQSNYEKERFIQSFKPRKEILVVSFLGEAVEENGCYAKWRFENAIQLSFFYSWLLNFMEQLIVRNIKVAK